MTFYILQLYPPILPLHQKICCWNEQEYRELSDAAPKHPKISAYINQRTQLAKSYS